MKIASATVRCLAVPDEDEIAIVAARQATVRDIVVIRLETACGLEGLGLCFVFGGLGRALVAACEELAGLIVGDDPMAVEAVAAKMSKHVWQLSNSGIFRKALGAIDCALWDIKGKACNEPLWKLLGGFRDRVPTYASGFLQRHLSDDDLVRSALDVASKGFKRIKLHLALSDHSNPVREVARARLVREALGPDIGLMVDVNERWRVDQAIDIGRHLEEVGLFCIEDPVRYDDYDGMAKVTRSLSTPVMAGENEWGLNGYQRMIGSSCVDILMIDVMHAGGITPWLKIAGMAEAFNIPVVSHILPEFQAQIVAAVPNGLMAEYKEWTWQLFDGVPELVDGELQLSGRPGHGLTLSRRFAVEF